MVIGGVKINKEIERPLIDKEDPIHILDNEYENFMYLANQFECNILKVAHEKIKDSLIKLTDTVNNINQIISKILDKGQNYDDDFQKIKLISFNVYGKCEEIYNKISQLENNFYKNKLENLNINELAENLKHISKNINKDVCIKILKVNNQLFNFEKYEEDLKIRKDLEKQKREEEMKNIESNINESCFLVIIVIFSVLFFIYYGYGFE